MATYVAGRADELAENEVRLTRLGKHDVVLIRRGASVFAVANRCPHQGARMCAGWLRERLDGVGAGRVAARPDTPVLACPWHGWEFDLATGQSVFDASYRIKTYPTTIADGDIVVQIGAKGDD
jgi:3-phenylpropionate/trans-cinnamate dioxygenase ferredoxin subunit